MPKLMMCPECGHPVSVHKRDGCHMAVNFRVCECELPKDLAEARAWAIAMKCERDDLMRQLSNLRVVYKALREHFREYVVCHPCSDSEENE